MKKVLIPILALASTPLFASPPAGNYPYEQCTQDGLCRKASNPELDHIRGGFSIDTPTGRLEIAIGITRAVAVNDQLVAVSQLVLPDVSQIIAAARAQAEVAKTSGMAAGQAAAAAASQAATQALANAAALNASSSTSPNASASGSPANGANAAALNSSSSTSANASASGSTANGGALHVPAPQQLLVNGMASGSGGQATAFGNALVIQNGPGNAAPLPASFNGVLVLPTIVQNSLNDQVLRTLTLVNASVSNISAFNALSLGEMLSRATAASTR